MLCPNCNNTNPDDARFCNTCGTKLPTPCPNCGHRNPSESKFCNNCGQALSESSPQPQSASPLQEHIPQPLRTKFEIARAERAMVGERRIVTMLFCDVKGSTVAAGQLDPEEWAEIMNGAFKHMIEPVYKYEGNVPRLMGDAILAFFGAPLAHEDDPERAVLAGLEIIDDIQPYREEVRRKWGVDFDVRVGINTGLVMVGQVGSDLAMEYTALGDAINLAARMEQTAQPGTIQIAEDTYKLVAPLFDFEDLGGIEVKGKDQPVHTYRALGRKIERGSLRGIQGLDSPLVGRDAELDTLLKAVSELRGGHGGVVSIIGDAGLGKSRLVSELRKSPTRTEDVKLRWLEGRSFSYETDTPYAPFIDISIESFRLQPEQNDAEKYTAIKQVVAEAVPQHADEIAPFLADMLNITPSGEDVERVRFLQPPQKRAGIFHAVTHFLKHLAKMRPTVLVFDDIHWIDPSSLDLLIEILPLTEHVPLLITALFRPQRQDPSWRFHEAASRDYSHRYASIMLEPLKNDSAAKLVSNLLHIDDLPMKVRHLILAKAEGNPFFVEEVIRSLLDAGLVYRENSHWQARSEIENISVPDTLAAVITARLDRLESDARQVVQTASVIGREFQFETLLDVHETPQSLDPSLVSLQRRELIREKSLQPHRIYMFKHALTQETAYGSLLLKRRRELHRRVGECLERNAPDRASDIARHFVQAQEPARALPYLVTAGERAAQAYATTEAIRFFDQALDMLKTVDNLPLARRVYEGLGNVLAFTGEFQRAKDTYQTMLTFAESRDDIAMQVSALNKLSMISALRMGQFEEGERFLVEADQRARQHEDKAGLSEMGLIRCMMCTAVADFAGVVRYMDETLQLGRDLGVQEQMSMSLTHIANSQIYMLQFDRAWESLQEGLSIAREIGDRVHEAELLINAAAIFCLRDADKEGALHTIEEGLSISLKIGALEATTFGYRNLGWIAHLCGEYERAIAYYQLYLDTSRMLGMSWFEAEALCLLSSATIEISTTLGDRMREYQQQAQQVLQQPAGEMIAASSYAELGFSASALGNWEIARERFQRGLDLPSITMNLERSRLLVGQAFVELALDHLDEATRLVDEAARLAEEHAMQIHYPLLAFAQGRVSAARGENEAALDHFRRAEELAGKFGMRPIIWKARVESTRILSAMEQEKEARAAQDAARAMIDEMADFFTEDDLRAKFLDNVMQQISHAHA